jgi:hypothetical protein
MFTIEGGHDVSREQLHILQQLARAFSEHDHAQVVHPRPRLQLPNLLDHLVRPTQQVGRRESAQMLIFIQVTSNHDRLRQC